MSADSPLDLTPRHSGAVPLVIRRRWPALVGVAAVVIALGFVLFNGLRNATVFFYNVDQAVSKRDDIGTSRVRLQGNVLANSIDRTANGVNFDLKYNGKVIEVTHTGEPPELFGPQIPIVIEGAFASSAPEAVYRSDRMLIRHDSTYDEKNQKNVRDAKRDAQNAP